jgi:hypothetical protein
MNRIEESRREVELRLSQLRGALRSEFGRAPKRRAWLLGLLAGAAGVAVAVRLRSRRRPTRKRRLTDG